MSEPAAKLEATMRVAIVSDDPTRRGRLAAMVASAGHVVVATENADVVLADGDASAASGSRIVSLGGHDDELAGRLPSDATA